MIATLPGTCSCGCRRPVRPGVQIQRSASGWVLAACLPTVPPRPPPEATYYAGPDTIREVLAHARRVAARDAVPAGGRR